jgi:hypothetical protein
MNHEAMESYTQTQEVILGLKHLMMLVILLSMTRTQNASNLTS